MEAQLEGVFFCIFHVINWMVGKTHSDMGLEMYVWLNTIWTILKMIYEIYGFTTC